MRPQPEHARMRAHLALTMGDPAGIGPEIALKALADPRVAEAAEVDCVGARAVLARCAEALGLPLPPPSRILEPPLQPGDDAAAAPGRVSAAAGRISAACVEAAVAGCLSGRWDGVVTGPIHKQAIHLAGVPFPGHTEWLAARCRSADEAMLMYHPTIAVVLATCHVALAEAISSLSTARIVTVGRALDAALTRLRGTRPRLAVLGLNPHAGEGGLFGDHEARVVAPAVDALRAHGVQAEGPLPPDSAFTPDARLRHDGWVCLYHDQGLIPFKALAGHEGVNVTLGLPIVRTSVDHGTAFDIAWRGQAEHRSLVEAIRLAARLAQR
jgi:4-hydroxythreonine-4-phosphate dehydrogenase